MELTEARFLRSTNKGHNEIYIVDAHNSPNVMWEIGRLREIAFRTSGGGTGKSADIDEFDTMEEPCQQLIVWNPEAEEIIGGYRFLLGENMKMDKNGVPRIAMSHMFGYSQEFLKEKLPYTLELGRSFVSVEYQSTKAGVKALYALDNLWDGLGALTVVYPNLKYFFGKMTMYPSYPHECRNMILYFLLTNIFTTTTTSCIRCILSMLASTKTRCVTSSQGRHSARTIRFSTAISGAMASISRRLSTPI